MKRLLSILLALAFALGIGYAARTCLFSTVRIAGASMETTLHSGDVVLVTRWEGPEHGAVMQCTFDGRDSSYVKRVIGQPGDTIEFSASALLFNGRPLSEPYVSSETDDMTVTLGPDEYFVLGDNRAESYDSRAEDMGSIRREQFLGRARWILWPVSRFGPVQ